MCFLVENVFSKPYGIKYLLTNASTDGLWYMVTFVDKMFQLNKFSKNLLAMFHTKPGQGLAFTRGNHGDDTLARLYLHFMVVE